MSPPLVETTGPQGCDYTLLNTKVIVSPNSEDKSSKEGEHSSKQKEKQTCWRWMMFVKRSSCK